MPGIADVEPRGVQVPNAPLVTPGAAIAGPDAVAQLVDAFRHGVITADDITQRIGEVHQGQQKALLQQAQEFTSPEGQAARAATLQAATQRAQLESAQAGAAQPLVQPQAEVAGEQIRRQKADQLYGNGISAYQQYSALFGAPGAIVDATGKPDYDAMGAEGNHMLSTLAQRSYAQQMLTPEGTPTTVTDRTGTYVKKLNKAGEDITEGSPQWKYYRAILAQPLQTKMVPNAAAGSTPTNAQPITPASTAPVSPVAGMSPGELVEPKTVGEARAQIANSGVPISQAVNMDANEVLAKHREIFSQQQQAKPVVDLTAAPATPAAPTAAIPVEPKPPIGAYSQGVGIKTGPGKEEFTSSQIMDDLHRQKSYEQWDQQKGFANSFLTTADRINKIPAEQQRSGKTPMNALDIALAESIIKMYDPAGAIREFKWDKLTDAQPHLERLPNWKSEFLHAGALTPEGRQRLIEMGYDNIQGKERAVHSQIQMAAKRAQSSGLQPADVLNEDELRILQGKPFGNPTHNGDASAAPASTSAAAPGKVVNIPGIGGVYLGADGQYHRAAQ